MFGSPAGLGVPSPTVIAATSTSEWSQSEEMPQHSKRKMGNPPSTAYLCQLYEQNYSTSYRIYVSRLELP